jgi:hypothetical protein
LDTRRSRATPTVKAALLEADGHAGEAGMASMSASQAMPQQRGR